MGRIGRGNGHGKTSRLQWDAPMGQSNNTGHANTMPIDNKTLILWATCAKAHVSREEVHKLTPWSASILIGGEGLGLRLDKLVWLIR